MRKKLLLCFVIFFLEFNFGTCIPFFGPFRRTTTVPPRPRQIIPEEREPRIINADHGGLGLGAALLHSQSPSASSSSFAGGNVNVAPAPWISGTRDQYILDQLVILHPDSPVNRDAWRESGFLNYEYEPQPHLYHPHSHHPKGVNVHPHPPEVSTTPSSVLPSPSPTSPTNPPSTSTPTTFQRVRKPQRKSKQQNIQEEPIAKSVNGLPFPGGNSPGTGTSQSQTQTQSQVTLIPSSGGLFDLHHSQSPVFLRELNPESESDVAPMFGDPIVLGGNSLFYPVQAPIPLYPYHHQTRATNQNQPLPPEAVIQLLKSPEQEMSPYSRPQVKLPFPLSHDCSSSGSGSKPLQFVVLPIVEPVAPLKPLIPKPSFLTSQYGQFPYIPPFNLFNRPPPSPSPSNSGSGGDGNGGGSSGQFVPILNRPAPPLPFVFVQSLPLELIGQNTEMDVIHAPASSTNQETKTPPAPAPVSAPVSTSSVGSPPSENLPRPLPLIVIEKVKTPGQPPSPVSSGATVVEISKQSVQRNSNNSDPNASPLSTISVVQPITNAPTTLEKQKEIQKAIEKLVPVAAAVLENVELQQQKEREREGNVNVGGEKSTSSSAPSHPSPQVGSNPAQNPPPIAPTGMKMREQDKTPLRAPLRPESGQNQNQEEGAIILGRSPLNHNHKKPDINSSEEAGASSSSTSNLGDVEVTEA